MFKQTHGQLDEYSNLFHKRLNFVHLPINGAYLALYQAFWSSPFAPINATPKNGLRTHTLKIEIATKELKRNFCSEEAMLEFAAQQAAALNGHGGFHHGKPHQRHSLHTTVFNDHIVSARDGSQLEVQGVRVSHTSLNVFICLCLVATSFTLHRLHQRRGLEWRRQSVIQMVGTYIQ